MTAPYDRAFFAGHQAGSVSSAQVIVPLLRALAPIESVVDVGCGTGAWLSVFAKSGVRDCRGLDGPWVDPASLLIPREWFTVADLAHPPELGRRFDLALCVEVAEHLPPEAAPRLTAWLTGLAPLVAFSAAIPGQGGTGHVNEQWPDHWARLFESRGYACIDAIRLRVWNDPRVQWWYAQNLLVYAERSWLASRPDLAAAALPGGTPPLRLVHPACFENVVNRPLGLGAIVRGGPRALARAIKARLPGGRSAQGDAP